MLRWSFETQRFFRGPWPLSAALFVLVSAYAGQGHAISHGQFATEPIHSGVGVVPRVHHEARVWLRGNDILAAMPRLFWLAPHSANPGYELIPTTSMRVDRCTGSKLGSVERYFDADGLPLLKSYRIPGEGHRLRRRREGGMHVELHAPERGGEWWIADRQYGTIWTKKPSREGLQLLQSQMYFPSAYTMQHAIALKLKHLANMQKVELPPIAVRMLALKLTHEGPNHRRIAFDYASSFNPQNISGTISLGASDDFAAERTTRDAVRWKGSIKWTGLPSGIRPGI